MKPVLVLVGRPNVGKSTLFNRLTKTRDALVADFPGLTRDRHYGTGRLGDRPFLVVDTGGFEPTARDGIMVEMAAQAEQAIAEADILIFLVDGRAGLTAHDREIAARLRRVGKPLVVAVNKAEGMRQEIVAAEFHELGLGELHVISSAHGEGVRSLLDHCLSGFADDDEVEPDDRVPKIAVAGRPNVGKSTLINALLGEERVIAFDQAGTTRDAISIPFERNGKRYTLIDTAGLRRKGRVFETIEKFSVIKTVQAIEQANVCVLVLDATQEVSDQDAHIGGFIVESGRALVLAINKWDAVDSYRREIFKREIARKLGFLGFARHLYISALEGLGVSGLFGAVDAAYAAAMTKLPTPRLTRALQAAVEKQSPPKHGLFRPKMRYAHQGGMNPPVIVIHGAALEHIAESYRRYLEHYFLEIFRLQGTPLRVEFRTAHNPFVASKK
ncbi:ribosome biogenesis GTPase Der [Methyloversatilis sp.]|uniref:ribosome biogenesis GTPase Der n=1 Tax=Methyloversatilis sp. TaxID=2569862 RepID=UPI0027355546|nr:ribosome biogenesis GTPase Der [Methyloversatilis sp.]MDP2868501.1 ribosome biogenesis GTPase Der [Methyloversatilis sp.]MDP3455131.1 ribosome biogenesis GTPase Der [Methyloversatilis sp.]MDP3579620.1 ribosome biogenesis GTPase Der [Methyloversatilis sp.]